MIVTFYKEWTNEYGHKFKAGETVELWDAHHALRAKVCVPAGEPIPESVPEPIPPEEEIASELPPEVEELTVETKTKKGTK